MQANTAEWEGLSSSLHWPSPRNQGGPENSISFTFLDCTPKISPLLIVTLFALDFKRATSLDITVSGKDTSQHREESRLVQRTRASLSVTHLQLARGRVRPVPSVGGRRGHLVSHGVWALLAGLLGHEGPLGRVGLPLGPPRHSPGGPRGALSNSGPLPALRGGPRVGGAPVRGALLVATVLALPAPACVGGKRVENTRVSNRCGEWGRGRQSWVHRRPAVTVCTHVRPSTNYGRTSADSRLINFPVCYVHIRRSRETPIGI